MRGSFVLWLHAAVGAGASLTKSNLKTHVDVLALDYAFNPVKASYWTGYPHHRRTPFAVSPDGKSAYVAYLDSSATDVHVQQLDPSTFTATGTTVTIVGGKEAGGLVAHDDGFALLTNEVMPSGTVDAPPSDTPVPVLYRYTSGKKTWKTWLGGPGVHQSEGLSASPDLNGDLVYSKSADLYGAYFVVTDYSGDASGHFGDSVQYVSTNGTLETIPGASSAWGCSHNTGIAFEAAEEAPFASICAEDQGAIWLNTKTQGMSSDGVKISNENTTNGASGEPMGGMSGSYSALARFAETTKYIFAWVSRGAMDVTENSWMGSGYTNVQNRTNARNVAISLFSDKYTKVGAQATSEVGAEDGDTQVNWITSGSEDCSNAHVATFGDSSALVTWEEISDPICDFIAMGCRGQFSGTHFQQVDSTGSKIGDSFSSTDVYVAGDMVTMKDGRVCWPYVSMSWDLSQAVDDTSSSGSGKKLSIACMSLEGSDGKTSSASSSKAPSATPSTTLSEATSAVTKAALSQTTSDNISESTSQETSGTVATLVSDTDIDDSNNPVTEVSSITSSSIATPIASASSSGTVGAPAGGADTNEPNSAPSAVVSGALNDPSSNLWGGFPSGTFDTLPGGIPSGFPSGRGRDMAEGMEEVMAGFMGYSLE